MPTEDPNRKVCYNGIEFSMNSPNLALWMDTVGGARERRFVFEENLYCVAFVFGFVVTTTLENNCCTTLSLDLNLSW